jgi:hypothetical protein
LTKTGICSEQWFINMIDAQKVEAAQTRLLTPSLGLSRLNRQRNPDIHNRSKVFNIVADKTESNELGGSPESNGQAAY